MQTLCWKHGQKDIIFFLGISEIQPVNTENCFALISQEEVI